MFGLEAIWRNGQVVGHVRRADFGFTVNKTIAYGYIRDPSGGPVSSVPCPFLDPRNHTCTCWEHRKKPGRVEECQSWSPAEFYSFFFPLLSLKEAY